MLVAVWQLEKQETYLAGKLLKVLADESVSAGRIALVKRLPTSQRKGSEFMYCGEYITIYISQELEILPFLVIHYSIQKALSKDLGGCSDCSILQQSGGLQKVDAGVIS